jgi:hypothetical protein
MLIHFQVPLGGHFQLQKGRWRLPGLAYRLSPNASLRVCLLPLSCIALRLDVILLLVLLARALLSSRSGLQKSNTVVGYLDRSVIQIGFFASVWAIGGLVTWFFLPKLSLYTVFNNSAGSMYTHVSSSSLEIASHVQ